MQEAQNTFVLRTMRFLVLYLFYRSPFLKALNKFFDKLRTNGSVLISSAESLSATLRRALLNREAEHPKVDVYGAVLFLFVIFRSSA